MVLGFKPQFVAPILEGTKIHTIREDEHNRWREGVTMHMATGVRTAQYSQFNEIVCTGRERIFMSYSHILEISIGDKYLYIPDKEQLARNDGFESLDAFEDWFIPLCKKDRNRSYSANILHWTDFRYSV